MEPHGSLTDERFSRLRRTLVAARKTLGRELRGVSDFLLPDQCLGCGRPATIAPLHLCEICFRSLEPAGRNGPLIDCFSSLSVHDPVILWRYEPGNPVRAIHHTAKYGGRINLGIQLGRLLGEKLAARQNGAERPDCIVPVPLHRLRRRERMFNQAEAIARGISDVLNLPINDRLITRTRATRRQSGLGREARTHNLREAFACIPGSSPFAGHAIVVDDVITTGATLVAVISTLQRSHAVKCTPAAIAITPA